MTSLFYYHDDCVRHAMGEGHPEQPARLESILQTLKKVTPDLAITAPPRASRSALERAHSKRHIDLLFESAPASGLLHIDHETAMNSASLAASLRAAGAVLDATEKVVAGTAVNAFCCVRPPGHHAERDQAMGFCLFNNVAVGACHALDVLGLARVAILDFDVHHGNGTEDIFAHEPRVLFCSSYQYPLYPGVNTPSIAGQRINVPLSAGCDGAALRAALQASWTPAIEAFEPELILVSAGFDAHRDDPLAQLNLSDDDYGWLGRYITGLADRLCDGRVVATLEGGYDLAALARSVARFVAELRTAAANRGKLVQQTASVPCD